MSLEPDLPVTVFYLATEESRGGFRWLVKQYGATSPVETGTETFASEADARKSGRQALIRASARTPTKRRRRDADTAFDDFQVG